MSSPFLIQSYGNNNFVVELKCNKKNKNNDDYDYIEKELKNSKKNKAYTTYTEISNEESLFFSAQVQKPNQKYYRDYTNYTSSYPDNMYNTNNNNPLFLKIQIVIIVLQKRHYYIIKRKLLVTISQKIKKNVLFQNQKINWKILI